MRNADDLRRPESAQVPEPARHSENRSKLCLQLLEMSLRSLRNQHGLLQVGRIDHGELRQGRDGQQDHDYY